MKLRVKGITLSGTKESLKDKIKEALLYSAIGRNIRRIWRFLCRVLRWLPVLWNQEEWDFEYMYDLLEMKMKELKKDMSKDVWHDQTGVQKGIRQIDVCLARLDRWRNWTKYYYYPMDDVYTDQLDNGCTALRYASERNEQQRLGAHEFEKKNYEKFWKDFLAWHGGWWT